MWKVKGYGKSVCGFEGTRGKREKRREWLSGGVSPCQGEGRGFESRLALLKASDFPELFLRIKFLFTYQNNIDSNKQYMVISDVVIKTTLQGEKNSE